MNAIEVFSDNYEAILNFLENMANNVEGKAGRSKARSFLGALESFSAYFMLRLFQSILMTVNPVHKKILSPSLSIGECRLLIERVVDFLSADAASDDNFEAFYQSVTKATTKIGLQEAEASIPCDYGKRTKMLTEAEGQKMSIAENTKKHFQQIYSSMMSATTQALIERHPAEDLKVIADVEDILLNFSAS